MNIDHCPTVRKILNLRDSYAPQIKRWFNVSFPIPSRFAQPGISVQKQDCKSNKKNNTSRKVRGKLQCFYFLGRESRNISDIL